MNAYELSMMDKHVHNMEYGLRGNLNKDENNDDAQRWALFFGAIVFAILAVSCFKMRRRYDMIIITEHASSGPYVEPVGSSTSVNMAGSRVPLITQQLSPIRRPKSQDPLEIA